jgi:hypothetical protein
MNPQSSSSGQFLTILILGFLGPFVLFLVPIAGIFMAPLLGLLTTCIVIHTLRTGMQRHMAAKISCVAVLLINFATVYVACEIWMAIAND